MSDDLFDNPFNDSNSEPNREPNREPKSEPERDEFDEFFEQMPKGFEEVDLRPMSFVIGEAAVLAQGWLDQDIKGGFRTKLRALDSYVQFSPGELTIIGARPGMGKTVLAMQIAEDAPAEGDDTEQIAVFSAEMSGKMLVLRMVASAIGVPIQRMRRGQVSLEERIKIQTALDLLATMPLWISDHPAPNASYMRQELQAMQKAGIKVVGVVYDFMELMPTPGKSPEEKVSQAAVSLKAIAKEFNIPVIAISQLNREVETRADKFPKLSDLRSSGMIEQIADQVLLLMRPKYYTDKGMAVEIKGMDKQLGASNIEDPCYVVIAKNRNGDTGIAMLAFDGPRMRFFDIKRKPLSDALLDGVTDIFAEQDED